MTKSPFAAAPDPLNHEDHLERIRCPLYMQIRGARTWRREDDRVRYRCSDTNLWNRFLPQKDNSSLYITSRTTEERWIGIHRRKKAETMNYLTINLGYK